MTTDNFNHLPTLSPEQLKDMEDIVKGLTQSFLQHMEVTQPNLGPLAIHLLYYSGIQLIDKDILTFNTPEYLLCYEYMKYIKQTQQRTGAIPPVWNEELFHILTAWMKTHTRPNFDCATC